uniref:Cytochrome P450 n=1 Tax=Caenorhabditis tropicalis TaxID=1561998 RepID=A0A1I7TRP6_9PELO
MSFAVIVVILAVFATGYYSWLHTYWSRKGVPGPRGLPFLGSFYELSDVKNPRELIIRRWAKQFGKVFGFYEGATPVLVVGDPDMLQELFIKKFENFNARKTTNYIHGDLESEKEEPHINVFFSQGRRWKKLRAVTNLALSVKSLKIIHDKMENCITCMVDMFAKYEDGKPFNILEYFQELTYDVICRTGLGAPYSNQWNNKDLELLQTMFLLTHRALPWYLVVLFPKFENTIKNMFIFHQNVRGGNSFKFWMHCRTSVGNKYKDWMENVKNGVENPPTDLIEILLEHYTETLKVCDRAERIEILKIITGCCFAFLAAGYDTTANTLAYTCYMLMKHPEKMEKAQKEIDEICTSDSISYDDMSKLKYVDAIIKETLRLFPVGWFACSRQCVTPTTLGKYYIEEGVRIEADVGALHLDKEVWGEDAEEWFDSSSSRNVVSWIPFGAGPRQCVGMRLAYSEAKTTLAHVLKKYTLYEGPETEKELTYQGCTSVSPIKVTAYLKRRD